MRKYVFFDADPTGRAEYDIAGKNYRALIQCCFKYCSAVALLVDNDRVPQMHILNQLEQYRIPTTPQIESVYFGKHGHYGRWDGAFNDGDFPYEVRCYSLCPQIESIFIAATDSIFSWLCGWGFDNPTDPTFFRKDGSIFFTSIVHEGECRLFLKDTENAESIVAENGWFEAE